MEIHAFFITRYGPFCIFRSNVILIVTINANSNLLIIIYLILLKSGHRQVIISKDDTPKNNNKSQNVRNAMC